MPILRTHAQNNSRTLPNTGEKTANRQIRGLGLQGRLLIGCCPPTLSSYWLRAAHAASTLPLLPVALGQLTAAQPMGGLRGGASGARRAHAGQKVNRSGACAGRALSAGRARGGVALLSEEPTFLQPGKAAACRPAACLSTPGSFLTRSSDSEAWAASFTLSRGAPGTGYCAALSGPRSGSAASRGLRVASASSTHVAAFLSILFLNSQTLELRASGSGCSLCQSCNFYARASCRVYSWGEVWEEVPSLFLFLVSFWSVLLFFQTLVVTLAVWKTHAFSCHITQPSHLLSVRGQRMP